MPYTESIEDQLVQQALKNTSQIKLNPQDVGTPMTLHQMGGAQALERYPTYFYGDNEDIYGRAQSGWSQLGNGFLKFLTTTGLTFTEGTIGMANGVFQAIYDGKFSSFYDNDFNRAMDSAKDRLENMLPNYYTQQERDDSVWSNMLTANFWSDTILKNAGFAVGAYLSGGVWSKGLGQLVRLAAGGEILGAGGKIAQRAQRLEQSILLGREAKTLSSYERAALQALDNRFSTLHQGLTVGANASRAGLSAISESGMEARHARQAYIDKMTDNYKETYGIDPVGEDLQRITSYADKVGGFTFGAGVALLTATNYIQFPKLAGSFWKGERAALSGAERGIARMGIANSEGKIVSRNATRALKEGESYVSINATTAIGAQLDRVGVGRWLNRASPYSRILVSPSEGFEEGMQEVISTSADDFYSKAYRGEDTNIFKTFTDAVKNTLTSKEGQTAILSGLITGGLMENIGSPLMGGRFLNSVRQRKQRIQNTQEFVNSLNKNKIGSYLQELNNSVKRGVQIEQDINAAVNNNDQLSYEDALTDAALNYILPRIQYGRTDLVQADIDAYKALASNEEQFLELKSSGIIPQDVTREQFINNLNKLESQVKTVEGHFEALNTRYGTLTDKSGNIMYNKPHLFRMAYAASKIDDYNTRLSDLYSRFTQAGIPIMDIADRTLQPDQTPESMQGELDNLKDEIYRATSSPTNTTEFQLQDDLLEAAADTIEITYRRDLQIKEYERLRDNPQLTPDNDIDITEGEDFSDPTEDIERPEDIPEDIDELLRDMAYREVNGEELTEEEQELSTTYEDQYQKYLDAIRDKRPTVKQAFVGENQDVPFYMEVDGELERGVLKHDPTNDRIIFDYEKGSIEVTNRDLNDGLLASDQVVSDQGNYLLSEDIRSDEVGKQRVFRIAQTRIDEISERRAEIERTLSDKRDKIEEANEQINRWESNTRKKGNFTQRIINALQELSDTKQALEREIEDLEKENEDLSNMQTEYQQILDDPQVDVSSVIDLLQRQVSLMEDAITQNGSMLNELSDTLDGIISTINKMVDIVRDKLTSFIKNNPFRTDAISANNNLIDGNITRDTLQTVKNITGFDIEKVQSREATTAREIDKILQDLESLEAGYRAKSEVIDELSRLQPFILNRLDIVDNATADTEQAFNDVTEDSSPEVEAPVIQDDKPAPKRGDIDYNQDEFAEEDDKKPVSEVYNSNAMPPEAVRTKDKNYIKWEYFLSKYRLFPDKNKYKVIYVTANNEKAVFKQGGYINSLYRDNKGKPYYSSVEESVQGEDPAVAIVMVKEVTNEATNETELHFVNRMGEPIGKVGTKIGVSDIVGWKMPSTSETFRDGQTSRAYNNYRDGRDVEDILSEKSKEWAIRRSLILKNTGIPQPRDFKVSRGSLNRGSARDKVRNNVVGTLISPEDVGKKGVIHIVTSDNRVIGGYKYKKGSVVLTGKDFNEQALTRSLSEKEKNNVFDILMHIAKNRPYGTEALNPLRSYLQGIMSVGDMSSFSPLRFGESFSSFQIGENTPHEMDEQYILDNKAVIIEQLGMANTNVNRGYLEDNNPFQEFTHVDNEGRPQFVTWNSYQEFLLSLNKPDGTENDPIIKVNISEIGEANPTFKDKYVVVGEPASPTEKAQQLVEDTGIFENPKTDAKGKRKAKPKKPAEETVSPQEVVSKVKPKSKRTPRPQGSKSTTNTQTEEQQQAQPTTITEERQPGQVVEESVQTKTPETATVDDSTKKRTEKTPPKEDPPTFEIGQQAIIDGKIHEITEIPKYGGFWIVAIENGERVAGTEVHVSGKRKNSLVYKAFLASQGTFASDRGPNIPCNG